MYINFTTYELLHEKQIVASTPSKQFTEFELQEPRVGSNQKPF